MATEMRSHTPEHLQPSLYDVVVVLGGKMKYDPSNDKWYYPSLHDNSATLLEAIDGDARAYVAANLLKSGEAKHIIVTGGMQPGPQLGRNTSRAQEMAQILRSEYKVSDNQLTVLQTVGNTLGNINGVETFTQSNSELNITSIGIISSAPHVRRAAAFIQGLNALTDYALHYIPIESFLIRTYQVTREEIKQLYQTEDMRQRRKDESQGVTDFRKGLYTPHAY